MQLTRLFARCLDAPYLQAEKSANYYSERIGGLLYIYLQSSDGYEDWKHNFDFPARPYRRMGKTVWYAHRGFTKVWRAIEPHVAPVIADPGLQGIVTVGYSHGGALAVFCHEYIWYHRPDLRLRIHGYSFGGPRVLWGNPTDEIRSRWNRFTVVRNIDDLITHLPPRALGYSHVGTLLQIGEKGKYSRIDAHRKESILTELKAARM